MTVSDRVRVKNVEVLSDDYYLLNEIKFDYRRGNGEWQTQSREVLTAAIAQRCCPTMSQAHRDIDAPVSLSGLC